MSLPGFVLKSTIGECWCRALANITNAASTAALSTAHKQPASLSKQISQPGLQPDVTAAVSVTTSQDKFPSHPWAEDMEPESLAGRCGLELDAEIEAEEVEKIARHVHRVTQSFGAETPNYESDVSRDGTLTSNVNIEHACEYDDLDTLTEAFRNSDFVPMLLPFDDFAL